MISVRDFTDSDWDAFAGCNSNYPKIGEMNIDKLEAIVVLDDNHINIYSEISDRVSVNFFKEFDFATLAVIWLETANTTMSVTELLADGFELM